MSEAEQSSDQNQKWWSKALMVGAIVGLVALPGMMTGQILSGVSPLIAVRYQIMIMTMALGASGMGAALMLWQLGRIEIHNRIAGSGNKPR